MKWTDFINELFIRVEPYLEARGDQLHIRIAHQYSLFLSVPIYYKIIDIVFAEIGVGKEDLFRYAYLSTNL